MIYVANLPTQTLEYNITTCSFIHVVLSSTYPELTVLQCKYIGIQELYSWIMHIYAVLWCCFCFKWQYCEWVHHWGIRCTLCAVLGCVVCSGHFLIGWWEWCVCSVWVLTAEGQEIFFRWTQSCILRHGSAAGRCQSDGGNGKSDSEYFCFVTFLFLSFFF